MDNFFGQVVTNFSVFRLLLRQEAFEFYEDLREVVKFPVQNTFIQLFLQKGNKQKK